MGCCVAPPLCPRRGSPAVTILTVRRWCRQVETTWACTYVKLTDTPMAVRAGGVIVAYQEARYDMAAPVYKVALAVAEGDQLKMVGEFTWGQRKGTVVM